jgi:hypothetical protein
VTARVAPHDEPDRGRSRIAERPGRIWPDFFRPSGLGASSLFGWRARWSIFCVGGGDFRTISGPRRCEARSF